MTTIYNDETKEIICDECGKSSKHPIKVAEKKFVSEGWSYNKNTKTHKCATCRLNEFNNKDPH